MSGIDATARTALTRRAVRAIGDMPTRRAASATVRRAMRTLGLSLCRMASVASVRWTRDDRATMAMLLAGGAGPIRQATMTRLLSRGVVVSHRGGYYCSLSCHCGEASYRCRCGHCPSPAFDDAWTIPALTR